MKLFRKEILELLIIAICTFVIVNGLVLPAKVKGSSMYTTLHDQDVLLMRKIGINKTSVKRFDIVVIYSKELKKDIVKRIIGLPQDKIEYIHHQLYINNQLVDEPYIKDELSTDDFSITLKDDEYFYMGDNRYNSKDARVLGPCHLKDIKSVNGYLVYPFDRISKLDDL